MYRTMAFIGVHGRETTTRENAMNSVKHSRIMKRIKPVHNEGEVVHDS